AGAKWEWFKKKLLTRLAIFKSEKLNARETDPSNSALTVLAGNQSVIGLELEATGQISEQWQVSGGYAFMRSRLESSRFFPNAVGSPLANVPRNTFNFWTTYRVANNLTIGGGANFVDSRRASTTSPNDPTTGLPKQVPSYWVFNAMAAYDITKSVQLQLNIYNLTDAYFIEQVHPSHLIPGEGRTAVVSMKVKL
ncbi:TonB-dependent receptor, partial [bacterium]|nr:TonB-dependent receptor [bacterium]